MAENLASHIPPHSFEAEKSTLGALLIDKDAVIKIADLIGIDDFYAPANAMIFEAILELYNKRIPIDILTVTSILEDKNKLDMCGGSSYLVSLTNEVPTATHVYQYAIMVKHKSTLRKLLKAGHTITGLGFDESKDIEELLEEAEKSLFSVSQTFVKDKFVHIKDVLTSTYEKIADLHDSDNKDKYAGVPTGFAALDAITSGLHPSDLVILAARPAMGKTAFALNIAQNVAKKNKSVGIISLEMSKDQLVERLFCSLLEVDSWKIKSGKLSEEDFARIGPVMDELNSLKIYIDDSLGNSIVELRAKTRRLQMEYGLDVLIIDYLQLMQGSKSNFGNRVNEISEISRSLKSLARELHIPIIALSQLSRAVETRPSKEPQLSDLRESGAIEQDADIVMMLYREDYYEPDTEKKGITDLFIRKHRNGPVGQIELRFQKERMRFYDMDKQRDPNKDLNFAANSNGNQYSKGQNHSGYSQGKGGYNANNNGYGGGGNNGGGYQNNNQGGHQGINRQGGYSQNQQGANNGYQSSPSSQPTNFTPNF
jgi:replicative DNA helicase